MQQLNRTYTQIIIKGLIALSSINVFSVDVFLLFLLLSFNKDVAIWSGRKCVHLNGEMFAHAHSRTSLYLAAQLALNPTVSL